jgi:hypothetical protein
MQLGAIGSARLWASPGSMRPVRRGPEGLFGKVERRDPCAHLRLDRPARRALDAPPRRHRFRRWASRRPGSRDGSCCAAGLRRASPSALRAWWPTPRRRARRSPQRRHASATDWPTLQGSTPSGSGFPASSSPRCAAVSPRHAGPPLALHGARRRPLPGCATGDRPGARPVLEDQVRLAKVRGQAERIAAVQDRDRRRRHPLHPRALTAQGRAAADHDPRLARLDRRAARDRRAAHEPAAHGGSAADAFDLVLPSIPGYGFSSQPTELGWETSRTARAWAELMRRLGYTRYVAQGGDVGAVITDNMGRQAPAGLLGIHMNLLVRRASSPAPTSSTT